MTSSNYCLSFFVGFAVQRLEYCNQKLRARLLANLGNESMSGIKASNLWYEPDEVEARDNVLSWIKSMRYAPGFNEAMGDTNLLFKNFPFLPSKRKMWERTNRAWTTQRWSRPKHYSDQFAGI